jgi:stage II sporulation protein AA (anti-sigma F factor antagonist)
MSQAQSPPLELERARDARGERLSVRGVVDFVTADRLQREGMACLAQTEELTVDLSDVTFMDSAGMKVLLDLSNHARSSRRTLALRPPRQLGGRRVVEVLGVPGLPWVD